MAYGDDDAPSERPPATITDELRGSLEELETYLVPLEPGQLGELVLPLASAWVLGDAGLDIERHLREARRFVERTPEQDRMLRSFPDAVTQYLSLRLTMNADGEVDSGRAAAQLERARDALRERARLVAPAFPTVAAGFARVLEETAGDSPPDDRLWRAMALRIGEQAMPRPGWSS